uniref:Protein kinase domain-containing protein n=1 Tax=Arcella intermedia TaxID=1963864 RepID=A0A6B2LE99_9EUKA
MTKTELASLELEITIMNFLGIAEEQCDYCLSSITSFDTAEFVYIVMPLAKCSILDIINKKQDNGLNSSEAATVMFGLLEAIQYLHKKSICHRDIKPENILVMDESDLKQCKLSDYGSSHNLNDGPMSQLVGTETYMAPEMLMGSYTPAVDYWSAGVVAYVLITACLPWKTDKSITVQIMEQQDWAPFEQKVESRKLDQSVVPFVKGLMQKDVNQRWDPETALNHNWIKENYPL